MRATGRVVGLLLIVWFITGGFAAVSAVATKDASPTPSLAPRMAGRLGGSPAEFEERFGEAEERSEEQLSYPRLPGTRAAASVAFADDEVHLISVEWADNSGLTSDDIRALVTVLAPTDGQCDEVSDNNELGSQVYPCRSAALKQRFTVKTMNRLGFDGKRGDFHFAIARKAKTTTVTIGLGHEKFNPPTPTPEPTATPTPEPTPTFEDRLAEYGPLADVLDLANNPDQYVGQQISFSGTVLSLQVAPAGQSFDLGDGAQLLTPAAIQVRVVAPDESTKVVFVGYDGDLAGIAVDAPVTVYGEVLGTHTGNSRSGGTFTQPLVEAFFVTPG